MKLTELGLKQYIGELASDAPTPGGGGAAALAGAQGAALCAMVAGLTCGRKKYEEYRELNAGALSRAVELSNALCAQIDADADAFSLLSAAYKLPKETDEERAARSAAIAEATVTATEAPLEAMRLSLEAMELTDTIVGKSNKNAASDLGVAALQLDAAVRSAWLNVMINLPGIADPVVAEGFKAEGEALVKRSEALSTEIYGKVLKSL